MNIGIGVSSHIVYDLDVLVRPISCNETFVPKFSVYFTDLINWKLMYLVYIQEVTRLNLKL
jgi:hypothetical protein